MNFLDFEAADFACDESFQRYCLEENDTDVLFWKDWLGRHPGKRAAAEEAAALIRVLSARQGNRLEQLKHLKDGIAQYDLLHEALGETPAEEIRAVRPRRVLKFAAALAGALFLAGAAYLFNRPATPATPPSPKENNRVINAGNGPRKTVVLPDGSSIILRKNSTVELAAGFSKANRKLTLTGEAFFDVVHKAELPMTVHAGKVDVRVKGTAFNVCAYPGDDQVETALVRGSIELSASINGKNQRLLLRPNEKVTVHTGSTFNKPKEQVTVPDFIIDTLAVEEQSGLIPEIAWIQNKMVFKNESFAELTEKMNKWYHTEIRIEDTSLLKERFTGVFQNESLQEALEALRFTYGFNYTIQNNKVLITK